METASLETFSYKKNYRNFLSVTCEKRKKKKNEKFTCRVKFELISLRRAWKRNTCFTCNFCTPQSFAFTRNFTLAGKNTWNFIKNMIRVKSVIILTKRMAVEVAAFFSSSHLLITVDTCEDFSIRYCTHARFTKWLKKLHSPDRRRVPFSSFSASGDNF